MSYRRRLFTLSCTRFGSLRRLSLPSLERNYLSSPKHSLPSRRGSSYLKWFFVRHAHLHGLSTLNYSTHTSFHLLRPLRSHLLGDLHTLSREYATLLSATDNSTLPPSHSELSDSHASVPLVGRGLRTSLRFFHLCRRGSTLCTTALLSSTCRTDARRRPDRLKSGHSTTQILYVF